MKNNTYLNLYKMGCGNEMLNSCNERGQLEAAIFNCNNYIKYAKECIKNHKESGEDFWLECAKTSLQPYYNELLNVEELCNKYRELWKEKYCKSKLTAEKILYN